MPRSHNNSRSHRTAVVPVRRAVPPIRPHQMTCSVLQAADAAGVAVSTVWLWINGDKLASRKVAGRRLVVVASLRALIGADEVGT